MQKVIDQPLETIAETASKREQRKASVKERILAAARTAFTTVGVNDADLAEIAQMANVGRATLYRYFDGKDSLQIALLEQDWDLQVAIFEKLVGVPKLDEKAITAWLYRLIRATAARLTTFPVYATSRKGSFLTRMAGQRVRLMDVLGRRFEGFAAPYKVDCLLVLFQIEQFVVHAAAAHDDAETAAGVAEIVAQLLRRLPPAQE